MKLPKEKSYGVGEKVKLEDRPSSNGYTFSGWYAEDNFEMPNEDVVIYGEWAKQTGIFKPLITAEVVDNKEFRTNDVVTIKTTITNPEDFDLQKAKLNVIKLDVYNNTMYDYDYNDGFKKATDVNMNIEVKNLVKENESYYDHVLEGSDDMPAHAKSSILGVSLSIPISNGHLNLGTWQGIYLCEFRNYGGARKIVATIYS